MAGLEFGLRCVGRCGRGGIFSGDAFAGDAFVGDAFASDAFAAVGSVRSLTSAGERRGLFRIRADLGENGDDALGRDDKICRTDFDGRS